MEITDNYKQIGNYLVAKRNDLIQKSRFSLTITEYKIICYCISKIKPGDNPETIYTIHCNEILQLIGIATDSYTTLKKIMKKLSDKSWWMEKDDGSDCLTRWFAIVNIKKNTGTISIKFHENMSSYLFNLQEQYHNSTIYFTSYELKNIMHMKCKYSPRLYELFRSYKKAGKWIFEFGTNSDNDICNILSGIDKDGNIMNYLSWSEWRRFNEKVLNPAIKEINELTDLTIIYTPKHESLQGKKTSKVSTILFEINR